MAHEKNGKRVTLQDIASQTGYSVNTVSRALRGMRDISAQTTEQIRAVMEGVSLAEPAVVQWIQESLQEEIEPILGGIMT